MKTTNADELCSLLSYDKHSGALTWVANRPPLGKAGQEAGGLDAYGYRSIGFRGMKFKSHRVIWLIMTGSWPSSEIDHVDGRRDNNKWENLREATHFQNSQNRTRPHASKQSTNLLGVTFHKPSGLWVASASVGGKRAFCKYFKNADSAHAYYMQAKAAIISQCLER